MLIEKESHHEYKKKQARNQKHNNTYRIAERTEAPYRKR